MVIGCSFARAAVSTAVLNGIAVFIFVADIASASEIVYTPINPTFGGSPLNSSQLQAVASAQKPNAPTTKSTTSSTQQSASQQFLQMLQSQLYASLASSVSSTITGQKSTDAGTIQLNTLKVSWYTDLDGKHITMTDASTGQVTQITIPNISSN